MNFWHVYLRNGMVYIPVVAKTDAGFYMDINPVKVFGKSSRRDIFEAIFAMISKGNPRVATPVRDEYPKPVMLKPANVKSWGAFEKSAHCFQIIKTETDFSIKYYKGASKREIAPEMKIVKIFNLDATAEKLAGTDADLIQLQ